MSEANHDYLVLDVTVLSRIPELNGITLCKYRVISNNVNNCTSVAYFEEDQSPCGLPTHFLIRIEKRRDGNPLLSTAALQRLAHLRLPHVVPKVWGAGHTETEKGTKLSYMLSQFYMDTHTLESVWDDMEMASRQSLAEQVVSTSLKLQDISLARINDEAKQILRDTPFETINVERPVVVGGPAYAYELVAIIGWQMAGFFPFAFEVGHKDTCLGLQNQSWTWYSLYRQGAGRILCKISPGARSIWSKLIRAMVLTDISRKDSNRLNVGNLVQKLWHEREKTEKYSNPEMGYVRRSNVGVFEPCTAADNAELELVALRRLGYID
ncbi:aminoglycoside phosphotransferase [Colletotrichum tofieldiae]|nr:aminoglycoside phosphotransferase [Colletotrichum tofieldiae]GKT80679.1 aminoglycoside phosphotransferase [Colletotrichum tofieldiae]